MDDDHIMVVTMGKFYIINKKTKEVCLSHFDENSYSLFKRESNTACMNVVQQEGRLVLCYDDEAKPVIWKSDRSVKKHVEKLFGGGEAKGLDKDDIFFDEMGNVMETNIQRGYKICRKVYEVGACGWWLKFTSYQAWIISSGVDMEIGVEYAYDVDSFRQWCNRSNIETNEIKGDLWVRGCDEKYFRVCKNKPINPRNNIYKGFILGAKVAVKVYPQGHVLSPLCIKMWRKSQKYKHSLVQFRGARISDGQYQIAFEVMKHNLFQFLEIGNHDPSTWTFVFSTLVTGLRKLHKKGIYHTCINPWNIVLTSDNTALFCGFSNLQKPEDHVKRIELEVKDLKDLATLIAYCDLDKFRRLDSEEKYPTDGQHLITCMKNSATKDAAMSLFDGSASLLEILSHPWLFSQANRMDYDKDTSECLVFADKVAEKNHTKKRKRDQVTPPVPIPHHRERMKEVKTNFFTGKKWTQTKGLPKKLLSFAGRSIDPESPLSLLKFIRNLLSHYSDVHKKVQGDSKAAEFVGGCTEDLERSLHDLFPRLTTGVYNYVKTTLTKQEIKASSLKKYYEYMFV